MGIEIGHVYRDTSFNIPFRVTKIVRNEKDPGAIVHMETLTDNQHVYIPDHRFVDMFEKVTPLYQILWS